MRKDQQGRNPFWYDEHHNLHIDLHLCRQLLAERGIHAVADQEIIDAVVEGMKAIYGWDLRSPSVEWRFISDC